MNLIGIMGDRISKGRDEGDQIGVVDNVISGLRWKPVSNRVNPGI